MALYLPSIAFQPVTLPFIGVIGIGISMLLDMEIQRIFNVKELEIDRQLDYNFYFAFLFYSFQALVTYFVVNSLQSLIKRNRPIVDILLKMEEKEKKGGKT
eukprot:CAMPEP_0168611196 /NCGR_PEP_ID=MMETSP0449_2-20121227/2224_1 /TAXON_ID=1082188 /ORGANISM="Strombidium rassoulzadegani, Strain ras09" /LENGTH=100 /DNA_ID=CAMNT_0008651617 /DNA_START=31 /DNA_END=333 /DNA_ORIENTATION=+